MCYIKSDSLVDKRDYQVNEVCDSRQVQIATLQESGSYSHDTAYVKLRHFMLSSLLALQDTASSKDLDTLDKLIASFKSEVVDRMADLPDAEVRADNSSNVAHDNVALIMIVKVAVANSRFGSEGILSYQMLKKTPEPHVQISF